MASSESTDTRLAVIEEKLDSMQLQQNRFFSHFQSEERARDDLKNRVTRLEERLDGNRWNFNSVMQIIMTICTLGMMFIMFFK